MASSGLALGRRAGPPGARAPPCTAPIARSVHACRHLAPGQRGGSRAAAPPTAAAAALPRTAAAAAAAGAAGGSGSTQGPPAAAVPAATSSSTPGSSTSSMLEETVDAIATVVELPDALASAAFQEHDVASALSAKLQELNSMMDEAITQTDSVLELNEWEGRTLPSEVAERFLGVYRSERKREKAVRQAEKAQRQEERARRRADRQQCAAAAASDLVQQELQQQQHHHQQQPASAAPLQQQDLQPLPQAAAAEPRQETVAAMQPLIQQQQQPQPPTRQRRRRTGSAAAQPAAAPAALDTSSAATAAGVEAAAATPAVPRSTRACSSPAAVAGAAPAALEAASSSTAALAAPAARAQPPLGFAPLPVLQQQAAAALPPRSSAAPTARRSQRASARGSSSAAAAAAARAIAPPPMQTSKLSDNTMHGLDMRAELLTADQEKELALMVQDLLQLEAVAEERASVLGRQPSDVEWMVAAGIAPASASFAAAAAAVAGATSSTSSGPAPTSAAAAAESDDLAAAAAAFRARLAAGRHAKQVMIRANYKLVVSICRKYQGHGMTMGDLINEGIAGLVKGVERFQPARGFKFSTYAHWWIRQAVSRALSDQGRLVRLPSHLQDLMSKISRVSKSFEAQFGREPEMHELAAELGVDAGRIRDAYAAVSAPRSLDQPMGGDSEGAMLGDLIEDERMMSAEESVYVESLKADLEGVLAGLSERDAGVLRMRFGLQDGREHTLDEVGARYQVTRERIRQIEAKAIRQLRSRQQEPGSLMADYQGGGPGRGKGPLAARTSSGTRKQS